MSPYSRGILVHLLVWLISCALLPFLWFGATVEALKTLPSMPLLFVIGVVPLIIGSAFWMLLFVFRPLRRGSGIFYHAWVAVGAALALLIYVDIQVAGDPPLPAVEYVLPAVLGFIIAVAVSTFLGWALPHEAV